MQRDCLKCGYQSSDATGDPLEDCPKCGAIYSKVEATRTPTNRTPHSAKAPREPSEPSAPLRNARGATSSSVRIVAGLLVAFGLGYWTGQVHLKREVAKQLNEAVAPRAAITGGLAQTARTSPAPPPPAAKPAYPLKAALISKDFRESGRVGTTYLSDAVTFATEFTNGGDKAVRAFDGTLRFADLLDNTVIASRVEINKAIAPGETLRWDGELNYNQFMAEHNRLRTEAAENLVLTFTPRKILFQDGTMAEFP